MLHKLNPLLTKNLLFFKLFKKNNELSFKDRMRNKFKKN